MQGLVSLFISMEKSLFDGLFFEAVKEGRA